MMLRVFKAVLSEFNTPTIKWDRQWCKKIPKHWKKMDLKLNPNPKQFSKLKAPEESLYSNFKTELICFSLTGLSTWGVLRFPGRKSFCTQCMPTCNTVVLDQDIRGVHPVTRSHLPSCLHEQRRPSSSLGLPTPHSLAYYDVFVVEVLPNTTAKLEDNHELICPIIIGYTRPALIRWKSKIDIVK